MRVCVHACMHVCEWCRCRDVLSPLFLFTGHYDGGDNQEAVTSQGCTATATAAARLGACLTLCSVCFSSVSDSLYSPVLLLRNKLPEDEEWPHFQNVHHCFKKKKKMKLLYVSNTMGIFLGSFKKSVKTEREPEWEAAVLCLAFLPWL